MGTKGLGQRGGIMLVVEMIELSRLKEDLQDPGKAHGPVEAQLFGAEAGEAASPSASSPTVSCSALAEALPQEALNEMVANLVKFFLLKYLPKQLTSQAEMLKKALRDNQEHFPVVFTQASECLQVVVGMEMKELDLREHIYIVVLTLGLTCDEILSSGQSLPKASLLVLVLSLIMQNEDLAPEEAVLGALSRMGWCVLEVSTVSLGEPRELLTQVWL
ncbi:hypothetical protein MG293_005409 [Ovis ammon polii]|uniref:MAGE domain-containing protein n=1 Tax=Ovis ammon polii TaxID=230172 RepID=A0AAD4YEL8_OVIAM|nr:hypothetical protein MG293_005409 [Ovis ammon polii]